MNCLDHTGAILPSLKRLYAAVENRTLDFVHCGRSLSKNTSAIAEQSKATVPTDWYFLKAMFADVEFGSSDVILDVGCGRGRSLYFLAKRFPKATVMGIELNSEIAAVAAEIAPPGCRVIAGDILNFCPNEVNVFYLFNPFYEELMAEFCQKILNPRTSYRLFYAVPAHLDVLTANCSGKLDIKLKSVVSPLRSLNRDYAIVVKSN